MVVVEMLRPRVNIALDVGCSGGCLHQSCDPSVLQYE